MKGITFWIAIGEYGGFHFQISKLRTGICLGWISFQILTMDIEAILEYYTSREKLK